MWLQPRPPLCLLPAACCARAAQGGGLLATASTASADSRFRLAISGASAVTNNSASTGGGLSLAAGVVSLSGDLLVARNRAGQGGGICLLQGCPTCSCSCAVGPRVAIVNNSAVVAGGGIYLDSPAVSINEAGTRAACRGNAAAFGRDLSLLAECAPGEVRADRKSVV